MKTTLRSGRISQTFMRLHAAPMIAIAFLTLVTYQASGQTFTSLHNFTGKSDGGYPLAPVIIDSEGNLYGTTFQGGDMHCSPGQGCGTVFKIDSSGNQTVLYAFTSVISDAAFPSSSTLIRDDSGDLFGTTAHGGTSGVGTVFEVDASGQEIVLYSFAGAKQGAYPDGNIARDPKGNIYGSARFGDPKCNPAYSGCGIVFKLTSTGKFKVLYTFRQFVGEMPSGLSIDQSGNLYGTTLLGGDLTCNGGQGCGTVFKIDLHGKLTTLYIFHGPDGAFPANGVIQDSSGNLYGTTSLGTSGGVVFKLDPTGNEIVLYTFTGGADGGTPEGSLLLDPNTGTLYGTTNVGGDLNCDPDGGGGPGCGTVYKIDASGVFTVLYAFIGKHSEFPFAGVAMDPAGNLYGTTTGFPNRRGNEGSVFKLAP
jgi:uncharacterized repeat protein (TIGR03803 family)